MLPRNERLGTSAFAQAFAQSRTFHHALLQMRVHYRHGDLRHVDDLGQKAEAQKAEVQKARVAFVVAKKLGRATVRNKVRRRLREAYRLTGRRNSRSLQNLDIIFMVKAGALEAQSAELCVAVDELLGRLANDRAQPGNGNRGAKEKNRSIRDAREPSGGSKNGETENGV